MNTVPDIQVPGEPANARAPSDESRLERALAAVAQGICTSLLVVMTVIIGWQIFGRFVLNDTPKWSEQLAGLLMVYLALIGGAIAVREDKHIALTWFRDQFGPRLRKAAQRLSLALIVFTGAVMLVYGVRMALLVLAWTVPTLGLSASVNYWAFPAAGVLIALFALRRLWRGDSE